MNYAALDKKLNEMILTGQAMSAFEEYYADDVTMQENSDAPCVGKVANRKREEDFFAAVEAWHNGACVAHAFNPDSNTSLSQWEMDITMKGLGRIAMNQCVVRQWVNGKVISERFFYNKG
jgi:hypothetical protein